MTTESNQREEALQTIDGMRTAMMCTVSPEGVIHSRPMVVAAREDNVLWFATDINSSVVDEIRSFKHATATFQGTLVYATLAGPAEIVDDSLKVRELWSEAWAAWFDSPSDPKIVLIKVEGKTADVWDLRGAEGLKSAMRAFTSIVARQFDSEGPMRHVAL